MTKDPKDQLTETGKGESVPLVRMDETGPGSISPKGKPDTFEPISSAFEESRDGSIGSFQGSIQEKIAQEVERKRREGAFPPSFERRLRDSFERLIPQGGGTSREDFWSLFRSTDRAAFMDIDVPVASNTPGVSKVKRLIRSLTAWYLNYLLQQITNFTANLMQLIAAIDLRIKSLEDRIPPPAESIGRSVAIPISEKTDRFVSDLLANSPGRLIIADCSASNVLSSLAKSGADVYGVDTDETVLDQLQQGGLDVRLSSTLEELKNVRAGSLGGVLLQGSYELESLSKIRRILKSAAEAVEVGGKIVLITHPPDLKLNDAESKISIDLAPGHLMHTETWEELLRCVTPKLSARSEQGTETFSECVIIAEKVSDQQGSAS
ncbi:MAG: hypothetical protein HKL81_10450 [Acidimicrobiaceae bacterium]|nr:hypothetical protein [Acidimicrobiaceae bacterium]